MYLQDEFRTIGEEFQVMIKKIDISLKVSIIFKVPEKIFATNLRLLLTTRNHQLFLIKFKAGRMNQGIFGKVT